MIADVHDDASNDVLYAKMTGSKISTSEADPADVDTIVNFDEEGRVVGLQIVGVSHLGLSDWFNHGVRERVPDALLSAVDEWIRRRA